MDQLLKTESGKTLMSALWGFGLAALLYHAACTDGSCIVIKSPPKSEINGQVYIHDDKCYAFKPYTVKCNSKE